MCLRKFIQQKVEKNQSLKFLTLSQQHTNRKPFQKELQRIGRMNCKKLHKMLMIQSQALNSINIPKDLMKRH